MVNTKARMTIVRALNDMEDLIIRCRAVSIPPRSNTVTQSDWMGMKQFFPGKPDVGGTVATNKNGQNEYLKVKVGGNTRYLRMFN